MSHPSQRLYQGPKKEKEYRRKLRQEQEATSNVVHLNQTQSPKEQKQSETAYGLYAVVFVTAILALCFLSAEIAMGWNVATERATNDIELWIWRGLTILPSAATCLLPVVIYLSNSFILRLFYWFLFLPVSCLIVHTWLDTHLTDKAIAKSERETPETTDKIKEIKSLEMSLAQLTTAMEIECRDKPNKPGSGNGDECKRYRLERIPQTDKSLRQANAELKSIRVQIKTDGSNDPTNAAIAKVLNAIFSVMSIKLLMSMETVRDIMAFMLTLTIPCSGLMLKESIKCLYRRR